MDSGNQPRQAIVYRAYLSLQTLAAQQFQASLAGKLLASASFDTEDAELALAVTIAGGCFLGIESEQTLLKNAVRNGTCDFMVNTLDEALRVLKNEIRKHQPLAAGLLGNPPEALAVMLERGVQPDIVAARRESADRGLWQPCIERGAYSLEFEKFMVDPEAGYTEIVWTVASAADMRRLDRAALGWLPPEDNRRRWIQQAETRFYRQTPLERVLGVDSEEIQSLIAALRQAGPWNGAPAVRWHAPDGAQRLIKL